MFRKAKFQEIDILHKALVAEAAQGRFDPRLAEEPYRSGLRKNLNNIRKKGRRLDEDVRAQLLVWDKGGELAGCLINSSILPEAGNEIWMAVVLPAFRGQGIGRAMENEALAYLHPRVDVFSRCAPEAQLFLQMNLRRGFLPLDTTENGVRVLKLPKLGSSIVGKSQLHQELAPFVEIPLGK